MIDDSQLEREVTALAVLCCLSVIVLHLPVQLARALAPSVVPLRLQLFSRLLANQNDLLFSQILLPFTLTRLNLRHGLPA